MVLGSNRQSRQGTLPRWSCWLPIVGVAVLWELSVRSGWVEALFVPALSTVVETLWVLLMTGALPTHVAASLARVAAGFVVALIVGVAAGAYLGGAPLRMRKIVDPFLRVLSQVNPFSLLPVFLLVFGSGEAVKVAALSWVALWPVLFFTAVGVAQAEPLLIKTARSFGLTDKETLYRVTLPAAVPSIFIGVRVAAGLVLFVLVGAEMLGTNAGLGWLVHNSAMNYQVRGIYASALAVMLVGFGFSRLLLSIESRIYRIFGCAENSSPTDHMKLTRTRAARARVGLVEANEPTSHELDGAVFATVRPDQRPRQRRVS